MPMWMYHMVQVQSDNDVCACFENSVIVVLTCTKLVVQCENTKCERLSECVVAFLLNARNSMNSCKLDLILMPNLQCLQPSSHSRKIDVNNKSMKLTIAALFCLILSCMLK